MGCFCQICLNQAKLIYNYRSHAKGDSQKFKIQNLPPMGYMVKHQQISALDYDFLCFGKIPHSSSGGCSEVLSRG